LQKKLAEARAFALGQGAVKPPMIPTHRHATITQNIKDKLDIFNADLMLWIRWKITPITTWCVEQGLTKQPKQVGNSYNHKQK